MPGSADMDDGQIYIALWERRTIKENPVSGNLSTGRKEIDVVCVLYAYPFSILLKISR